MFTEVLVALHYTWQKQIDIRNGGFHMRMFHDVFRSLCPVKLHFGE